MHSLVPYQHWYDMETLETVRDHLPLIDEEIAAVKSILESNYEDLDSPLISPLIVFYSSPEQRYCVVSTSSEGDFPDVICRISEALNIYPLISAYASVVSLNTNIELDGESTSAINTFVLNEFRAWSITIPYKISDRTIVWLNEQIQINKIDDLDLDDVSRDMVSMFYLYVNIEQVHFTLPDLLSYLSTMGTAINFMDNSVPSFFDMSEEGLITEVNNA